MSDQTGRERDLVLALNQYAFIMDETKGGISVYVGPNKTSLAQTDRPVTYNAKTRKFERCELSSAIVELPQANEGWYMVLDNPAENDAHPTLGTSNAAAKLRYGRKINIPGPTSFPLWPGQSAQVIEGHRLRSNQYLVVRVYNEDEARKNEAKAVIKPADPAKTDPAKTGAAEGGVPSTETDPGKSPATASAEAPASALTIGQLMVICGTKVSFYMPPTGIEVVPEGNSFVREAVTLERLEYCVLLAESGEKRIVKGPAVVFPEPTETFVEKDGSRKYKATELNPDMGIYIKVTADYEENGKKFTTGQELFITGREQQIYYPRPEHAVIKYGDRELHYGVTITEGEARYVLNKETGAVEMLRGPKIFLADPRKQVIVRRVLEENEVKLWFPNNAYALAYNQRLLEVLRGSPESSAERALAESSVRKSIPVTRHLADDRQVAGDAFQRGNAYTAPRTLTLDTKFEGAVAVSVWAGYAIKINAKTGESRVVVGPKTELLAYDETLQVLELSTGKPKTTDRLERTVYLRVHQNQVSDIIKVVTGDMVDVTVKLSYKVNFEGQPENWFRVENYVKFLCDHVRSVLRHVAKQHGIEEFNSRYVPIVRDAVLGAKPEAGKRKGMVFEENGLNVYDVEVLTIEIGDQEIARMLADAQHQTVRSTLDVAAAERRLAAAKRTAEIDDETAKLEGEKIERDLSLAIARFEAEASKAEEKRKGDIADQKHRDAVTASERARVKADRDQAQAFAKTEMDNRLAELKGEVDALVEKAKAVSPQLVSALQSFGDRFIAAEAAKSMAPLAILGGKSVVEILRGLFDGTPFAKALPMLNGSNGEAHPPPPADRA
jgi:major vault protein